MPFLEGPFAFTGKLDMLSAYRMRGVDKIVVRRKGGPSREKVKTSPGFENTRRTMSEFGGCSRHGSYVRMAMLQLRRLSDYNFGSDINSIMRQVQLRDGTSEWGRRSITLSEHTRLLEGFSTMYKAPSFDSIVRTPVYYTMDRSNRSARIEIPELMRDINYFPQNNHAMFRLTVTLGIVPDVAFDVAAKEYLPPKWYDKSYYSISISTDWNPSLEGMESTVLELAMDVLPPDNRWTLMLSIGIEYGAFREGGKIDEVKRFGAAKILALRGKEDASDGRVGDDEVGEEEVHMVDETMIEGVPVVEIEKDLEGYREPEVRYVYIMKEGKADQEQVVKVYTYTISMAASTNSGWRVIRDAPSDERNTTVLATGHILQKGKGRSYRRPFQETSVHGVGEDLPAIGIPQVHELLPIVERQRLQVLSSGQITGNSQPPLARMGYDRSVDVVNHLSEGGNIEMRVVEIKV
jgi:hypothetical protein